MSEPTEEFLTELAKALREAKHPNVAEHFTAGLLWALYPEWFEEFEKGLKFHGPPRVKGRLDSMVR